MFIFFIFMTAIALVINFYAAINDETFLSTVSGLWAGAFLVMTLTIGLEPTALELCKEYSICYELVETIAENTDYSEIDIAKFFVIVSDDVEAWDAIKMLDNSLTYEQINAIMEISAMKQVE